MGAPDEVCFPATLVLFATCKWLIKLMSQSRSLLRFFDMEVTIRIQSYSHLDISWWCALFCLAFLLHMLCGSCTGGIVHFSCGVNVNVTNFVGKWIMAYWKLICWRPMSHWNLNMLSFYNYSTVSIG